MALPDVGSEQGAREPAVACAQCSQHRRVLVERALHARGAEEVAGAQHMDPRVDVTKQAGEHAAPGDLGKRLVVLLVGEHERSIRIVECVGRGRLRGPERLERFERRQVAELDDAARHLLLDRNADRVEVVHVAERQRGDDVAGLRAVVEESGARERAQRLAHRGAAGAVSLGELAFLEAGARAVQPADEVSANAADDIGSPRQREQCDPRRAADLVRGHFAYIAAVGTVFHRGVSGEGRSIDASPHDTCALTTEAG